DEAGKSCKATLECADRPLHHALLARAVWAGILHLYTERCEEPLRCRRPEIRAVVDLDRLRHTPGEDRSADQEPDTGCARRLRRQHLHSARENVDGEIDRMTPLDQHDVGGRRVDLPELVEAFRM